MTSQARQTRLLDPGAVRFAADGLVAAVVQDADDGRVLMVAWQDAEAIEATLRTGEAHFHSRSRGRLWKKGETSGNTLAVVAMELDCDGDAVLIRARPAGPTCHTGARSCFDEAPAEGSSVGPAARAPAEVTDGQDFAWLEQLWATIDSRARTRPEGSYTTQLLESGVDAVARKVAEEANEVVMAAKDDAAAEAHGEARVQDELTAELADLIYHSLVLIAERGLAPGAVIRTLKARHSS
jgi:phosphoribosyl-ATP pyrophosphohydrolase/phosphoribosyl-AMP cyclohydrolase